MTLNINTRLTLNSGHKIPVLGYGVYQTPSEIAEHVTSYAIQKGYRHVDSAVAYRNERASSAGMLRGGESLHIPRDQLFFTTKIPPRKMSYDAARASIDETLRLTGLDYVDLYLLHSPYGQSRGRLGAWRALVEGVEAGKIKSIGVSNYGVHHLEELEQWQKEQERGKGGIISVNQIELHPWLGRRDIVEWCQDRGIVLEAYSPLVRATRMDDPLLQPLIEKYNKTPAQILLRWGLQKGFVVLPKSVTESRIEENADVFDFELDDGDMASLETDRYEPCTWDPTVAKLTD